MSQFTSQRDEPNEDSAARRRAAWRALGLAAPRRHDVESAAEPDDELLLRLIRRELPPDLADSVYALINAYESWERRHTQLLASIAIRDQGECR